MPHPIPLPVRQVIVQRAEQGQSASLIARSLGLVSRTVRQLLQRLRVQGNNALATAVFPAPIGPERKMTLTPPVSHTRWWPTIGESAAACSNENAIWIRRGSLHAPAVNAAPKGLRGFEMTST